MTPNEMIESKHSQYQKRKYVNAVMMKSQSIKGKARKNVIGSLGKSRQLRDGRSDAGSKNYSIVMSNNDVVTIVPNVYEPSIKYAALMSRGNEEGSIGNVNIEEVNGAEIREPQSAGVFMTKANIAKSFGLLEIPKASNQLH